MNKKTFYIVLAVLIVGAVVAGFFLFKSGLINPTPLPKIIQTQEEVGKISQQAMEGRDPLICVKIEKKETKDLCREAVITLMAIETYDLNTCNQIEEKAGIENCQDRLLAYQSVEAGDESLCEQAPDKARIDRCKEYAKGYSGQ